MNNNQSTAASNDNKPNLSAEPLLHFYYELKAKEEALRREGLDLWFNEVRGTRSDLDRFLVLMNAHSPIAAALTDPLNLVGIRMTEAPHMPTGILALFWKDRFVGLFNLETNDLFRIETPTPSPFQPRNPSAFDPRSPNEF